MIGHGASEFGLDFLTSFFPQSAVSARVFVSAGQVPRLLESLKSAVRQLEQRQQSAALLKEMLQIKNGVPLHFLKYMEAVLDFNLEFKKLT